MMYVFPVAPWLSKRGTLCHVKVAGLCYCSENPNLPMIISIGSPLSEIKRNHILSTSVVLDKICL